MIEFTPLLDEEKDLPIYLQLYEYIKSEIELERFSSNEKLPSIRKLSNYLQISQTTVESAYQQLLAEGYVVSKPRKGIYIMPMEEKLNIKSDRHLPITPTNENLSAKTIDYEVDFHQASIDVKYFPINDWRKCASEVLYKKNIFLYGDPQGEQKLREQLAHYLLFSRGVNCSPEQIYVGAGTQQLLGMLCLLFKKLKYKVAIENPGYKGARDVFINHELNITSIDVDLDGISIEELYKSDSNVVYMTPSHQYPTGVITPITKRKQLLKWASVGDRYIIEDDYDSEFRYVGKPIPSLQGLDSNNKVIYMGTFSKSFVPAVRMSYMVLPSEILRKFKEMYASYDQTVSKIHQEELALFMEKGYFHRHVRRVRKINKDKRDKLLKAISEYMSDGINVLGEKSGVFILIEVKINTTEDALIQKAKRNRVKVYGTSMYWDPPKRLNYPVLQLGFGGLSEREIEKGIYLLSKAWFNR